MAAINNLVITINREYGAGGRSVAKGLAEEFSLDWYDYDFIQKAAEQSGLTEEEISRQEELLSEADIWIDRLFSDNLLYEGKRDKVFNAEKAAIIDLAVKPCILVGRVADAICKAANIKTFSVFLYADMKDKVKRAVELHEYKEGTDPEKYVRKIDAYRRNYYRYYTGQRFNDPAQYDICISTSSFGIAGTVECLTRLIRDKDASF